MVVLLYGVNGNLSKRKLLPALRGKKVIGIGRRHRSDTNGLYTYYVHSQYEKIRREIEKASKVLIYVAVPPQSLEGIFRDLNKIVKGKKNIRIAIEKPFGLSYNNAIFLYDLLTGVFQREQIYFVDHYLHKPALSMDFPSHSIAGVTINLYDSHESPEGLEEVIYDLFQSHALNILRRTCPFLDLHTLKIVSATIHKTFLACEMTVMHTRVVIRVCKGRKEHKCIRIHYLDGSTISIRLSPSLKDRQKLNNTVFSDDSSQDAQNQYHAIFQDLQNGNRDKFINFNDVLLTWRITEALLQFKGISFLQQGSP